jgi:hypothetical protein
MMAANLNALNSAWGWRCIKLTRSEFESGEVGVLMGVFRAAYIARNGPEGMAMFGCWNEDASRYYVYTTPLAFRHIIPLLQAYSATPIDAPDADILTLIYGDASADVFSHGGFEA